MFGSPRWIRLPSGELLNLAALARIVPGTNSVTVIYPAAPPEDFRSFLEHTYYDDDARAILNHFERAEVVVVTSADPEQ